MRRLTLAVLIFLPMMSFAVEPAVRKNQAPAPATKSTAPAAPTAGDVAIDPSAGPLPGAPNGSVSSLEGFLEPFIYDGVNSRDPFMPYVDISVLDRPLSPAQRYEIEQLKLVGIMWDIKDPKAMFLDPQSEVLILGRDEGIGSHNGYIATIRESEVVVVEAGKKKNDPAYKTRVLRIER